MRSQSRCILQVTSVIALVVLLLLGSTTVGSAGYMLTLPYIGVECACAVGMAVMSAVSVALAFGGAYQRAGALILVSLVLEVAMLFLLTRTDALKALQAEKIIAGLHVVIVVAFTLFGAIWHRSVSRVSICTVFCTETRSHFNPVLCSMCAGQANCAAAAKIAHRGSTLRFVSIGGRCFVSFHVDSFCIHLCPCISASVMWNPQTGSWKQA